MQQNMSFFSSVLQEPNLDGKMPPFSCTDWVAVEVTLVTSKLFTGLGSGTLSSHHLKVCPSNVSFKPSSSGVPGKRHAGTRRQRSVVVSFSYVLERAAFENCRVSLATLRVFTAPYALGFVIVMLPFCSTDSLQCVSQSHRPLQEERGQAGALWKGRELNVRQENSQRVQCVL